MRIIISTFVLIAWAGFICLYAHAIWNSDVHTADRWAMRLMAISLFSYSTGGMLLFINGTRRV